MAETGTGGALASTRGVRLMWKQILMVALATAMPFAASAAEVDATEGCGNNPERPYVCDIGPPRVLTLASFEEVLAKNAAIRSTVTRIGMPDRVEVQRVRVREPWSEWETRLYYRALDRLFIFGRAYILGSPQITLLRHESRIPRATWAMWGGGPSTRSARSAAERAADAAERSAEAAERTARLAEAMADDAAAEFPKKLMKQ